jgi:hypothetical protein
MSPGEVGFLALSIGAFTLLGGVLAWASWMESREAKQKVHETSKEEGHPRQRDRAF